MKTQGSAPRTITLDGSAASHRAVREMKTDGQLPANTKVRSSKYLNNLIEQDHRGAKLRIGPMLGFKWFKTAAITIAGIELLRRIHKGQFDLADCASKIEVRLLSSAWTSCSLPLDMWMKLGMLPRRSSSVCIFTAALVERKRAQGNTDRHRSMVVESSSGAIAA
jgi:hypothetical protein